MSEELLDLAIATTGGRDLWSTVCGLKVDISIGGPIWAMKGWPPGKAFDQILTVDTIREHIVFTPFTRPDQQMVFDAATDSVTMQTLGGEPVETLAPARAGLLVPTRRRVFRRNPDNTVNLNLPSITLDIRDVELVRSHDEQAQP